MIPLGEVVSKSCDSIINNDLLEQLVLYRSRDTPPENCSGQFRVARRHTCTKIKVIVHSTTQHLQRVSPTCRMENT